MNTILLFIIAGLLLSTLSLAFIAAMFYYRNNRLEEQLDERIEFSINQGIEIMLLQERLGISECPSDEVLERLIKESEHEELIFMNTQ